MSSNSKKKLAHGKKTDIAEPTTFIVMILRPRDPGEDPGADPAGKPNPFAVMTGWCVIAGHGLEAAMRHLEKIDLGPGVDLRDTRWTNVAGGKTTTLADGKMIQVLPAPLYVIEAKEPLVVPPYIMYIG